MQWVTASDYIEETFPARLTLCFRVYAKSYLYMVVIGTGMAVLDPLLRRVTENSGKPSSKQIVPGTEG